MFDCFGGGCYQLQPCPRRSTASVREWHDVDPARFRDEIVPGGAPALLRGAVRDWPAVRAGRESPAAMAHYLRGFDTGVAIDTMFGEPGIGGQFFYNDDLSGLNFERRPQRLAHFTRRAARDCSMRPHRARSTPAPCRSPANMPGFTRDNALPLIDARDRAARVDRQSGDRADALRRLVQHRLRRRRAAALHAVSARAADQSVCRSARVHAGRPADQHGETRRSPITSGIRDSATRSPPRRWPTSNPATRCSFRTCGGTTLSRSSHSTCWSTTGGTIRRRGTAHRSRRCAMH